MNPLFIFNSLIAIQSYIYKKDPVKAGDFLAKFAELVRITLENSRVEFVLFEKEIKTLEVYLALQSIRFEDKFTYQIDVADNIDEDNLRVPPMFAQPFIENAIEHGLRHKPDGGLLKLNYIKTNNHILCTQKNLGGLYGMYAGDGDANGTIETYDKTFNWGSQAGLNGYFSGDFDMNGQLMNQDKNEFWYWNFNKETQVP